MTVKLLTGLKSIKINKNQMSNNNNIFTFLLLFCTLIHFRVRITPEDPRWVGAWWVGPLVASALFLVSAIPISMYGAELPSKWSSFALLFSLRMGSKLMPLANFHRNCWRDDRIHALYVFLFLTYFNRCINYTCRHNILREIYFCTNPTHRRLGKMVGRSVENENEIRADMTRALLNIGSKDIYAKICTVYDSNSMSFSSFQMGKEIQCRRDLCYKCS